MTSGLAHTAGLLSARFAERDAADTETYPSANVADAKAAGLLMAPFPERRGGAGASLADCVEAIEAIAMGSASSALILSMPVGFAGVYGSNVDPPETARADWNEQVERVAEEFRAGALFAACNSEKGAGGSLAATKTLADRAGDGTFRLTGEKILATSGRFADYFFSSAKVPPEQLPGAGVVELFAMRTTAPGVAIQADWNGFGMRATESQTVRYESAPAEFLIGFPNFIELVQPFHYWYCLFAAIPLGCAAGILKTLGTPTPQSPALRVRFNDALMRYESLRAYLLETARDWRAAAGPAYAARVLRTKSYVTQESTKLAAELFAVSGGRHYSRSSAVARALADSFAGTALRPPLALALDGLAENFSLGALGASDEQ
jgi:alkylation response protein AidB-like acyl-CoA dehydrogenase